MLLLQHCSHALPQVPSVHNPIPSTAVPMFGVQQITVPAVHTRQPITTHATATSTTAFAPNVVAITPNSVAFAPNTTVTTTSIVDFAPNIVAITPNLAAFAPTTAVIATSTADIAHGLAAHTPAPDRVTSSTDFQLSNHRLMQTRSKSGIVKV
ncbi:hypothetical protein U1Q18_006767 [Sarracenia purpurea var. burkii]